MNRADGATGPTRGVRSGLLESRAWGTIRARLVLVFSLLFIAILISGEWLGLQGLPFSSHEGRISSKRYEEFGDLGLVADLMKDRIVHWLRARRNDTRVLARNQALVEGVAHLHTAAHELSSSLILQDESSSQLREQESYSAVVSQLEAVRDEYDVYDKIQIVDHETRRIFVSTDEAEIGSLAPDFGPAHIHGPLEAHVSDLRIDPNSSVVLSIAQDIVGPEDQPRSVVIMVVAMDDIVRSTLLAGKGFGPMDEAVLVDREMRILTPLKYRLPDGSRGRPLEYVDHTPAAALAAAGEEGITRMADYRGEPVLAAYRYIRVTPELGWGLVVKRDEAEVLADIHEDIRFTALTGLVSIVAIVLATIIYARRITAPIMNLSQTAQRVEDGDLAARASVTTSDEVGSLAATFNSMVGTIESWHNELAGRVSTRTAELEAEAAERGRAEEAAHAAQEKLFHQRLGEAQRVQSELDKIRERLVKQTRLAAIGQIGASIAHELRNPLGAVRNAIYFIRRYAAPPEAGDGLEEHLAIIDEEIAAADRIISDLAEMTRWRPPIKQMTNLGKLIRHAFERADLPDTIHWSADLDPEPFMLEVDAGQLLQVVSNLISNAVQALQDAEGEIRIEARRVAHHCEMLFHDSGPGVATGDRDRLFEPLFTTKAKGSGLGLTICQDIISRHGGSIELVKSEGTGCGFRLCLPMSARAVEEELERGQGG